MTDILPRRGDRYLIIDDPYSSEPLTPEAQAQLRKWYEEASVTAMMQLFSNVDYREAEYKKMAQERAEATAEEQAKWYEMTHDE